MEIMITDTQGGLCTLPPLPQPPSSSGKDGQEYLEGLIKERDDMANKSGMELAKKLISQEIEKIQNGGGRPSKHDERKMADITKDKSIKLTVKVLVPVREHPKFNFVGKLLGPKGKHLQRLQEETMTKMAILGRGSMRDRAKEDDLRLSGDPKFQHLSEDLHVEVAAVAPPAEAHARIAYALTEIRRYLVPDYNDEIRQEQMREIQIMKKKPADEAGSTAVNTEHDATLTSDSMVTSDDDEQPLGEKSTTEERKEQPILQSPIESSDPCQRTQRVDRDIIANKKSRGSILSGGRRSVLSLLTNARQMQQHNEQNNFSFKQMQNFSVMDPLVDLSMIDASMEDFPGGARSHVTNAIKVSAVPGDRARFRHDPYPRLASSLT